MPVFLNTGISVVVIKSLEEIGDIHTRRTVKINVDITHKDAVVLTESTGNYREGIGDTVLSINERKLCDRGERCNRAILVTAVHGVSTGSKGLTLLTSVGRRAGSLTVHNVGGDGKDRCGGNAAAIGVILSDMLHKSVDYIVSDRVNTVIVVTKLGEIAINLIVGSDTCLVSDNLNLCVLNSGKRIRTERPAIPVANQRVT